MCSGRRTSEVFLFVYRVYDVRIDMIFFGYVKCIILYKKLFNINCLCMLFAGDALKLGLDVSFHKM
jgi:hypothetical protein